MQRDYWYSVARTLNKLESPEEVGQIAAERTLRRLGARKVKTAKVPIVFDPQMARSLVDHIFEAVNGDAIYRGASFLAGKLGEKIAGENVTVIDDGTIRGGFGTSPFDGEGVPTRRTVVIENGVLKSYLLNTYTAKKLGLADHRQRLARAGRNPGIGAGNFFLQPGTQDRRKRSSPECKKASTSPSSSASASTWSPAISRAAPAALDLERRADLPGRGDHRRRKPERHAVQHRRNRQRSGISRRRRRSHAAARGIDRRGRVIAAGLKS